ncbi:hypothetical protein LSH36_294g03012 [Paralvinella palmiformis]|uniref:Zinc transporter 1 n=1 Tax=Paralvinella palmiformis TaxID=53620 RepID=A0AAD9JJ83_9ANNE|nr:hypothetical protein LSH36_294g03012 [Paralvinella palmiformis]
MGRYSGKTCRLSSMIVLTSSFFLVEIVVGYVTNSLALVGDAYHMLSDVIALFIGVASVRIAKWHSRKNTYGWARAEVLGALVNAVFLIALCFTILMEALQRLVRVDPIEEPDLLLIVGGIGLAINLIGLVLFGHHSHSHGGHSHLSNVEDDMGAAKKDDDSHSLNHENCDSMTKSGEDQVANMESPQHSDNDSTVVNDVNVEIEQMTRRKMNSSAQLNMRGVFLHVMGDALGSVIVIISALVVKYVEADWRYRIDPAMSIVLVAIILSTSIPLLKESALILLQTVPTHIQVQDLQKKLINKVEGVIAVHEFHIWQLAGNRIIASAHIHCRNLRDYMRIAEEVKQFFHNEGIHSTTIQPEFVEFDELRPERDCILECGPDKKCFSDTCCNTKKKQAKDKRKKTNVRQRTSGNIIAVNNVTANVDGGVMNAAAQPAIIQEGTDTKL